MRALAVVGACVLLGGCFLPPPMTGDGCPWGGCKGTPAPRGFEGQFVPADTDPFTEGGRFVMGQTTVWLDGEQLRFQSPHCRYEAIMTRADGVKAPDSWRAPSPSRSQIYRIARRDEGCGDSVRSGDMLLALSVGWNWPADRVLDRLWLGAATSPFPTHILDRR